MKKIIAILCIFTAAASLIWKGAERVFTTPHSPAATRTIATVDPEGAQTTKTEPLGKVVTIARISVAEGTQLIVKDGKIEPVGAGQVITDKPLVDTINNALSWASLALLFIAGLFLYCFSCKGKKERIASRPEPESAAAE